MAEIRRCGFCKSQESIEHDNPEIRVYRCTDTACDAVEIISKGASWWYREWERPDGHRINGDGKRDRRAEGRRFEWWRVYTEGADYETLRLAHQARNNVNG